MELIEIIKNTIFLITLFGIGIFTLSYSIYKLRNRHKYEPVTEAVKPAVPFIPEKTRPQQISQKDKIKYSTAERFIIINEISEPANDRIAHVKGDKALYRLQSIRKTGMHTLIFN